MFTVRTIFELFLKLKNVQRVQAELLRLNLTTKPYATPRGRASKRTLKELPQ